MATQAGTKKGPVVPKTFVVIHNETGAARLVKSKSQPGAVAHVSGNSFSARLATAEDLYAAGAAGVKIEIAADAAPATPPAGQAATGSTNPGGAPDV